MNSDDFEKRLQNQSMRQIPTEWREDILRTAKQAPHSSFVIRHPFLSTINHQLSTLLWLNPKAWAGLAAAWLAIFALQFASRDGSPKVASTPAPQSSVFWMSLKAEQQTLTELMGNNQPEDADQPQHASPKPRSERRRSVLII